MFPRAMQPTSRKSVHSRWRSGRPRVQWSFRFDARLKPANEHEEPAMRNTARFGAAVVAVGMGIGMAGGAATARDLSVVSWGGAYQDAQKEVYFKPFMAKTNVKMVDESWDGGIGVLRAKMQGG